MKKVAILLMMLFVVSAVEAQTVRKDKAQIKETKKELKAERVALRKLEGPAINPVAKNNFETDFGNIANVSWRRTMYFDEATFTKGNKVLTAYYDPDGTLVGTTAAATFANLPAQAQNEIKTKYKDYRIDKVIYFDDNELNSTDMMLYDIQFDDIDSYFVELTKGPSRIVLQVKTDGVVAFFKKLS